MAFLKAYKSDEGYIGKIDASEITFKSRAEVKFIVILDQSESMGDSVQIFVNIILPRILIKLGMENVDIHLITFSNSSEMYTGNMTFFENLYIYEQGCTYMKHAVKNLEVLLKQLIIPNHKQNIRILTISDGDIFDQPDTLNLASKLFLNIKKYFTINSQAVRFFTSSDEPDTRALSSMLQFNTLFTPQLIDLNADSNYEDIAETIANLYRHDGMNFKVTLKTSQKIFKENPWNPSENSIDLFEGENVIWMDRLPEEVYIRSEIDGTEFDCDIPVQICEELTVNNYRNILDKKIEFFMRKLKVLKIVNTQNSIDEMKTIIKYFERFEKFLQCNRKHLNDIDHIYIKNRVRLLKNNIQKRDLYITNKMKEIQNNDRVNQLNSRQLADFLRNIDINKDGKSLSRRGMTKGLDFDIEARKEVLAMAEHLDEIKDIDDSTHYVSFYSTATTLEGIKSVCELADDQDILAEASAIDIIKLLNIVGIGCDSYIGNYTDPMIYRIKEVYLGCYVSLSDVLIASEYNGGKNNLVDYNTRRTIVNVIPVFEDQRIQQFLLKYAPKLLEYTASIGMRRVLVEVPYTYEFTIESGILKLFKAFAIVQAFLYKNNENRMNTETQTMTIIDIENFDEADRMVRNYVSRRFKHEFEHRFSAQQKLEINILEDELVLTMLTCNNLEEFKNGFQNGLTRGNTSVVIKSDTSLVFLKLKNELEYNYKIANYPLLFEKVCIILFGRDANDQVVWNNGNICKKFNKVFNTILKETDSERYDLIYNMYRKRNIHIYRPYTCNRHGHSNDKPSFWALGYKTIEEMFSSVSKEEIDEYKSIHIGCCGL
ncbi:hypothetical protein PIROE2DRAFT_11904 [Piromyces sp. E2]|nr:hypothetical protein PIROE2DRAFT_11904 [Piromyces sp. E2]|eukprot:OUM61939.1 hypothetical protein PIROE2DRAFT_11904 [Piromyces sp. E2]